MGDQIQNQNQNQASAQSQQSPAQHRSINLLDRLKAGGLTISPVVQEALNKPLTDPTGVSQEDQAFLQDVVQKVTNGQINLYQPDSLVNKTMYDKLDEIKQGKVDMNALTLLSNVRQIKDLYDHGHTQSFQIQNLVNSCRLMKERIEKECGDCYII